MVGGCLVCQYEGRGNHRDRQRACCLDFVLRPDPLIDGLPRRAVEYLTVNLKMEDLTKAFH